MKKFILLFTMMLATTMGLLAQGTTWQTATLINSGATKTGTLDASTTVVWYKITVAQEGKVELTVTSSENLTLYRSGSGVYGYWNDNIQSWGAFSGNNYTDSLNFTATNVGKGTYYIKINRSSGSGGYTLKYTYTPCPLENDAEPNNDYENASLLQSGTTQGRLGYRTSEIVTDNEDWYKIVVPEEGSIELIATATENLKFYRNGSGVYGYWSDDIQSWGSFSGDNYADSINFTATNVGKGTYYIRITRSGGSGGYTLKYTFTPCPLEGDFEPNDDYQHYNRLINGMTTEARLGYRTSDDVTDNVDWYRIIVPKDGDIELVATATESLNFYRADCSVYLFRDNNINIFGHFSGPTSYPKTVTYTATNVSKGTYYIKISRGSGSGGYTLRYNGPISDIPGDVDGDGEVNIGDISDITDYLLNGDPMSPLPNGDADGDGRITIGDVTALIDILLGS